MHGRLRRINIWYMKFIAALQGYRIVSCHVVIVSCWTTSAARQATNSHAKGNCCKHSQQSQMQQAGFICLSAHMIKYNSRRKTYFKPLQLRVRQEIAESTWNHEQGSKQREQCTDMLNAYNFLAQLHSWTWYHWGDLTLISWESNLIHLLRSSTESYDLNPACRLNILSSYWYQFFNALCNKHHLD